MPLDIKAQLKGTQEAIDLMKSQNYPIPEEATELVEVYQRCLKAEEELARLREAVWPGLPTFVPTPDRPQEDFYIIAAEGLLAKANQSNGVAMNGRTWSDIASSAYAAYGASTGNKNFRGDPMPRWDQLSIPIRTAWEAAVRHAADVSAYGSTDDPGRWAGWQSPNYKDQTLIN